MIEFYNWWSLNYPISFLPKPYKYKHIIDFVVLSLNEQLFCSQFFNYRIRDKTFFNEN